MFSIQTITSNDRQLSRDEKMIASFSNRLPIPLCSLHCSPGISLDKSGAQAQILGFLFKRGGHLPEYSWWNSPGSLISLEPIESYDMDFVEVAQYNANGGPSDVPLPPAWHLYRHPNGDFYFYNPDWRLITQENVRDTDTLEHIIDAREEYLQELQDDPASSQLPDDYEVVISNVTASTASFRMYSRSAGRAYTWNEETGMVIKPRVDFWTFLSEYPSHHPDLPPNTEAEFVLALNNAKITLASGVIFPYSEAQIDQIFARYSQLLGQRAEGQNISAQLGWLMGLTMPFNAVGRRVDDDVLASMMNGLHF